MATLKASDFGAEGARRRLGEVWQSLAQGGAGGRGEEKGTGGFFGGARLGRCMGRVLYNGGRH